MAADEDADVFEITDFTTASEWERFIAKFEEVLHDWKLLLQAPQPPPQKDEYTLGKWGETTEEITFADFKFHVTHHFLMSPSRTAETVLENSADKSERNDDTLPPVLPEMMAMETDFPSRAHCLCRWYGLRSFVTVSPTSDTVDTESRIKLLLSSASVALNNCNCPVPVFIQILQKGRRLYTGVCIHPGVTTDFDMVHLKRPPSQYNHLAGLLNVFKAKMAVTTRPLPPVSVTVRFTYVLQDWINSPWPQTFPDIAAIIDERVDCPDLSSLPFGACEDPVSELHLWCTWPCLAEEMIIENQAYTDLDPLQAPQWSVRVQMRDNPHCLLSEYLDSFLQLCTRTETTQQLLGSDDSDQGADMSHALQRLTEPGLSYNLPSISSVVTSARSRLNIRAEEAPIRATLLKTILEFVFPDAAVAPTMGDDSGENDGSTTEQEPHSTNQMSAEAVDFLKEAERQLKSAPLDSLTSRLSVAACIVNHEYGGLRAVAHLWQEFVLEMRYRWENGFSVTGIEGSPNLGSCILHQKIQMLNCCVERKKKREEYQSQRSVEETRDTPNSSPTQCSESDDDEFYECYDDQSDNGDESQSANQTTSVKSNNTTQSTQAAMNLNGASTKAALQSSESMNDVEKDSAITDLSRDDSFHSTSGRSSVRPVGRLFQCGNLTLMNSNEPMYVPVTQEPSPMTEDMLDQHAEALASLGTSTEGTILRARMQSACLLSDMESFKAANPGCSLEDFVRWYSPRDWVEHSTNEDGSSKGELSHRMKIAGNMWAEVWMVARCVPARRQKRLFDDTREAEKVLHFFASLLPSQVVLHLLPPLLHTALQTIARHEIEEIPNLKQHLTETLSKMSKATRSSDQDIRRYTDLLKLTSLAETVVARAKSLRSKFTDDLLEVKGGEGELRHFVTSLLQNAEVPVRGGPLGPSGSVIHKMFVAAQRAALMIFDDIDIPLSTDRPPSVPVFPKPAAREYILRSVVPRPAPFSRPSPQRMFCILMENEFRLAGAFSKDTTFQ